MFPEAFTILLPLYCVAALGLALTYLRRRRMTSRAHALWGIFALLVPVLGPFLVIAVKPGGLKPPVRHAGAATPPARPGAASGSGRRPRPRRNESQPARGLQSLRRFSPR
jgi:hypothetical protein